MFGLEDFEGMWYQNLFKEVDYLFIVFGGGFVGGFYVAVFYDYNWLCFDVFFVFEDYVKWCVWEVLAYFYVGILVCVNFNFCFWFIYVDDGDVFECVIDDQVLGYKS